jgi:uncharacterized membrane protein
MKRTIIPKSNVDRVFAGLAIFLFAPALVIEVIVSNHAATALLAFSTIGILIMVYAFPNQVEGSASVNEYSAIIERISAMGTQLSDLNSFLEKERTRIADIEATVRKLNDEKTKLEPIVSTQREIVEAILAAHSERNVRQAWKERLLGFILGVIASLIASFVYGYFTR